MSSQRPLRGGCQCGRNRYIIEAPKDATEVAQVLFDTETTHRIPLATPLSAFIRVPLSWYQSTTYAFFPDETHSMIRRAYEHPSQQHCKRHFCGFCGTPLSYWSEYPRSEADYIQLTLASLEGEDLRELEELGLVPDFEDSDEEAATPARTTAVEKQSQGVPWFDSMMEGSRLGNMRRSQGVSQSKDGHVRVEWEIVEWTEGDDDNDGSRDTDVEMTNPGKRKLNDRDDADAAAQGVH